MRQTKFGLACAEYSDCYSAVNRCTEVLECCSSWSGDSALANFVGCKNQNLAFQRAPGSKSGGLVPWPSYICMYKVHVAHQIVGYDTSLENLHDVSVRACKGRVGQHARPRRARLLTPRMAHAQLHACARRCSNIADCKSFDHRESSPNLGMHSPNCILRPVSAAAVEKWAYGLAPEGSGWSYYERKAQLSIVQKDPALDAFNTCGQDAKRMLPPKRGGAVAFARSDVFFSARFPFYGTYQDAMDQQNKTKDESLMERTYCDPKTGSNDDCMPVRPDDTGEDALAVNSLFARDGTGMPDVLLFGGVYDDGCTSQDMWRWDAKERKWGWRTQVQSGPGTVASKFEQTAMPDPLCTTSDLLEPRYNALQMLNRILHSKVSPWQRYQLRRIDANHYDEALKAHPPLANLCPPAARVGANAHMWLDRFVLFGGATWRKAYPDEKNPRVDTPGGTPQDTQWKDYNLHDILTEQDLVERPQPMDPVPYMSNGSRSHSGRPSILYSDVWVLQERKSGGALYNTNFFWTLVAPEHNSPRPMGRFDAASFLDQDRGELYVFGGRSFNRSFNDLWHFDLVRRRWEELTPARGDRPRPRHGAAIASLARGSGLMGTLIMSFGREIDPSKKKTDPSRNKLFREIWTFSAVSQWKRLDYDGLCGCSDRAWDSAHKVVKSGCDSDVWRLRCPFARWGHQMVIPPLSNDESGSVLFLGGWGPDGKMIRSLLKLNLENSQSGGGGPCTANCFQEVVPIKGIKGAVTAAAANTKPLYPSPCETCEKQDSCRSNPFAGQAEDAPRVDPRHACTESNSQKLCASSHLPVICPISGRDEKATAEVGGAVASHGNKRIFKDTYGNRPMPKEAQPQAPCRVTSPDAETESLRAVDLATIWNDGTKNSIVFWACSRCHGPLSVSLERIGLNGFLQQPGFAAPASGLTEPTTAQPWLLQACAAAGTEHTGCNSATSPTKCVTCAGVSLGDCRAACERFPDFASGSCCDETAPMGSVDFFGRPCRGQLASETGKKRCHKCVGFLHKPDESGGGQCTLVHYTPADYANKKRFRPPGQADDPASVFFSRETLVGHPGEQSAFKVCPMLSSGYKYWDASDVNMLRTSTGKTVSGAAKGDLDLCQDVEVALEDPGGAHWEGYSCSDKALPV